VTTAAIAVLFVGLVSVLSISLLVSPLAGAAAELDDTDLALGSAAVTRAAVGQATVFAVANANGTATPEAAAAALADANANLEAMGGLIAAMSAHSEPPDLTAANALLEQGRRAVGLLADGEITSARQLVDGEFEVNYRAAVDSLNGSRNGLLERIDAATSRSSMLRSARWALVALLLPALAALVVWLRMKRRIRETRAVGREQLEAANLAADKSHRLLLAMSHRFRNPLTSIYGLSAVLAQAQGVTGLNRELAALVNAESAELYRIAEDALIATQLDSGTLQTSPSIVGLADTIDQAVKPIRAGGININVSCGPIWVVTDAAKLQQIIRNLVSNAVQHGAEPVLVEASEKDGVVRCSIVDHGDGLEGSLPPIGSEDETAPGIGLRVARELAALLGVPLDYSRDDGTTRFTIWLSEDGQSPPEPRIVEDEGDDRLSIDADLVN
jgi:signal transduction histidine kinase